MADPPFKSAILDLIWSAWTELGVPGAARRHSHLAIDPEPLTVFSPFLAASDPRLVRLIAEWCERHADRLSMTRIWGLQRHARPEVQRSFERFAGEVGVLGDASGRKKNRLSKVRTNKPPPLQRPALVRLRMRSLAGVGARADILCELLASSQGDHWVSASDLRHLGYSKRSAARVLIELTEAGIALSRPAGNALTFRLPVPARLAVLVAGDGLLWPKWSTILEIAALLLDLGQAVAKPDAVRRVKAHSLREVIRPLALAAGLSEPPLTSGEPAAFDAILDWGLALLRSLGLLASGMGVRESEVPRRRARSRAKRRR